MVASRNSFRKESTDDLRKNLDFGACMANGHMQHQALSINVAANHLSLFGGSLDIIAL
jgi:hypothetical protein